MAFPLVVNARSAAVEAVDGQFSQGLRLDLTMTRTTRMGMLFRNARSGAVEVMGLSPSVVHTAPTSGQFIPPIVEPF